MQVKKQVEEDWMIAIVGADGFLGTNLIKAAVERGIKVRAIVRSAIAARIVEDLGAQCVICASYATGELAAALAGVQSVIHLIATGIGSEEQLIDINVGILERVIAAATEVQVQRLVYLSGLGVGDPDADLRPLNTYFQTKTVAEERIRQTSIPYIIFRPSFIIGPGDDLIPKVMQQISSGRVYFPGSVEAVLQPIFIDDAVKAILDSATGEGQTNQIYDLIGPDEITAEDFVRKVYDAIVETEVNIAPPLITSLPVGNENLGGDESLDFLGYNVIGDPQLVTDTFNLPSTPLDTAITQTVRWVLKPDEQVPDNYAVVLLSGGLDSVTTLYWAIAEGYSVIPITMQYELRPTREIRAVREHARRLGLPLQEVPTPYLYEVLDLKLRGYPVPSVFGAGEAYVPYRNLIFNAIASYFADIYGARCIISGHILSDPLPDANQEFFTTLEQLVSQLKVGHKAIAPKFLLPLKGKSKEEVVQLAVSLGVPVEWTWSCEFDGAKPCGLCKPCRERAEAFAQLNLEDPVITFDLPEEGGSQ